MKRPVRATILVLGDTRVVRADFDGETCECRSAARPSGSSLAAAAPIALELGGKVRGQVWVLSEEAWAQKISLNPAQVAGLTPEQLQRALAFEIEPFSGLPVAESIVGYQETEIGTFSIVEISRADRDALQTAIAKAGGRFAGLAHASHAPADPDLLPSWLRDWPARLQGRSVPVIAPPASKASPNRFWIVSTILEAAALLFVLGSLHSMEDEKKKFDQRNIEIANASRELESAKKQITALKGELTALEKEQAQRERVVTRRAALFSLLNHLAVVRPEDVVIRSLQAEGPSSLIISGLSLEAGSVEDLSIALTDKLRAAGWTAQPRQKTAKNHLPGGGPWEFSLTLTHEETAHAQLIQLSQRGPE